MSANASQSDTSQLMNNEELIQLQCITDQDDLDLALADAGSKLVVLAFFLFGNEESEKMLQFLSEKASVFQNSIVVLTVDVANSGPLVTTCEALQIPWFIFLRDTKKIEAYHTINCHKIGNTIRNCLGEDSVKTIKTYVKNESDLNKRLEKANDRLVLLAFMIPGDESGERLNTNLDELEERNDAIRILKVDVDTCKDLTAKFNIQGVPTVVFMKNKTVLEQICALKMDKLLQHITEFTKKTRNDPEVFKVDSSLKSQSISGTTSSPEKQYSITVTLKLSSENSSIQK